MSFYVSSQPSDTDLTAVAAISAAGMLARTGAGTAEARTITGTANRVTVTDGDGVAGNPTLTAPQDIHTAAVPQFANVRQTATRARLASAVTNVTTTLANLTELSLTLTAGRKYTGTLVLQVNEALAADGFKVDLGGGTATFTAIRFGFDSAIGATLGTRTSAAADTALTLTALADTSDVFVTVQITLEVNAGGTFIPRQAKQADAAGGTLTLRAGGYLWLEDTP